MTDLPILADMSLAEDLSRFGWVDHLPLLNTHLDTLSHLSDNHVVYAITKSEVTTAKEQYAAANWQLLQDTDTALSFISVLNKRLQTVVIHIKE